MTEKRTAAPVLQHRDGKGKTAGTSIVSASDSTMNTARTQGHVESFLPYGERNAIPTKQLVQMVGYRDARSLQAEIERERADGALILSKAVDGGGYFLPENRAEIARYEATLRRRALSTLRTLKTARAALQMIDGQMTMESGGEYGPT